MDRNRFNAEVRPHLHRDSGGRTRGIAFDRLELDAWAEQYAARNGRPAKTTEGRQMSRRRTPGLTKKRLKDGRYEWYIDKRIKGYGRLCESTGTGEIDDAEDILAKRVAEIRRAVVFGERPHREHSETRRLDS
jgi:hypothetical protein